MKSEKLIELRKMVSRKALVRSMKRLNETRELRKLDHLTEKQREMIRKSGVTLDTFASSEYASAVGALDFSDVAIQGLELPWQEFMDSVDLMIRDSSEDPSEPSLGIDLVELGGFDESMGDGRSLAAAF